MSRTGSNTNAGALSKREQALWHAIKRVSTFTASLMAGEIVDGVTGADYAVLSRVEDLGGVGRALGQSVLGASLGWEKSRLSHQLKRMESRKLVRRARDGRRVTIELLKVGTAALGRARPAYARLIRHRLLARLSSGEAAAMVTLAEKLPIA